MGKAIWLPFVASLLQAAQPAFGGCLPPEIAAERMDAYFAAPRSAATYRALAGLGDPGIRPFGYDYYGQDSIFQNGGQWEEVDGLLRRMLPVERTDLGGSTYAYIEKGECRTGYAVHTAQARLAAFGANHPYVRQWFAVQRAVFSACSPRERPATAPLPPPLAVADPALARLQRDDRAYQAASQLFYRKSPGAPAAFRRIAASRSGHAPIARYMMLVIKAEWRPPAPPPLPEPPRILSEAEKRVPPMIQNEPPLEAESLPVPVAEILAEARHILADPRLASIHPLTQALVGSLGYHSDRDYRGLGLEPHAAEIRREQVRLTLEALHTPLERLRTDVAARERYARALEDIDKLHGDFPDPAWWLTGAVPDNAFASRAMAAAAKTDKLAAWVLAPKSPYEAGRWGRAEAPSDPYGRWDAFLGNSDDGSDAAAWDLVATSLRDYYDEAGWRDGAVAEAVRCADDAALAALPTRFYHQVRTALMWGYSDPSKRAFALALTHLEAWPWRDSAHYRATVAASLRYLIASGRIADARKLRDRLVLKAEDGSYDLPLLLLAEDEDHFARQTSADAAAERPALFNLLSVGALTRLAARDEVPAEERARFARIAWTRLYAMGKPVPAALDRLMRRLNPEITRGWTSRPGRGARPGDRRLLLDVLRSPALNILIVQHQRTPARPYSDRDTGLTGLDRYQHSDNNWWCAWQSGRHAAKFDELLHRQFFGPGDIYPKRYRDDPLEIAGARPTLAPLLASSYLWRAHSAAEEEKLSRIDCAPRQLSVRAIAWAKSNGPSVRREGEDEALALAVRTTRYGCQRQGGHGAYSKAAFTLLHQRYPDRPAAKRTHYWFDCAHFSGGCPPAAEPVNMD